MGRAERFETVEPPSGWHVVRDRLDVDCDWVQLTGTQAVLRLLLEQARADRAVGLRTGGYVSGYRGSPVGGIDLAMMAERERLSAAGIQFNPGLNEELAATAVWGSQQIGFHPGAAVQGAFALWYGKAPGVDRTGDVFKHGNYTGAAAHGGVLALAGDDAMAKSSVFPSQSDYAFVDAEMPVLAPSSLGECIELGLLGYALSRYTGLWVGLLGATDLLDATESLDMRRWRPSITQPPGPAPRDAHELTRPTRLATRFEAETLLRDVRLPAALAWARANRLNRSVIESPSPRLTLVGVGAAFRTLRSTLAALGLSDEDLQRGGVRLVQLRMPWPLSAADAEQVCAGAERVLVIEHKRALVERQLRDLAYGAAHRPPILGKRDAEGAPLLRETGQLSELDIARALAAQLPPALWGERSAAQLQAWSAPAESAIDGAIELPARTPYFCAGCPHNSGTAVSPGERAIPGVGCHVLAETMGRADEGFTQMGGEGVTWLGQAPFRPGEHRIANLGDGTFCHSGSLAVRAALAAKVDITFRLLFNDAVAMTGGQPLEEPITVPRVIELLRAEGVEAIELLSDEPARWNASGELPAGVLARDRSELAALQADLSARGGVTAIVFAQPCATERRRQRKRGLLPLDKRRLWIDPRVCEGCGDCAQASNCIALAPIETAFGEARRIDDSACNQDFRCAEGHCPSFVSFSGGEPQLAAQPSLPSIELPEPAQAAVGESWGALLVGVGGAGITTTGALLSAAAHLQGLGAESLGMAGLAQKGGPVAVQWRLGPAVQGGRLAGGEADLVLAADLLGAAQPANARLIGTAGTVIGNRQLAPTAAQAIRGAPRVASEALATALVPRAARVELIDAAAIAEHYLGDAVYANTVLLGAALQRGLLPLGRTALERAIEQNGAAVARNLAALRLGRLAVAAPEALSHDRPATPESPPAMIDRLAAELRAYQSRGWAVRYRRALAPLLAQCDDPALIRRAALQLYRLMAYKDEYEVARLHSRPAACARRAAARDRGARPGLWLAPPWLGPRKRHFGPWVFPLLRLLQHGRWLRGCAFDPFGWQAERRVERTLIDEYCATLREAADALVRGDTERAAILVGWSASIRGYGHVKAATIALARQRRERALTAVAQGGRREPVAASAHCSA